MRFPARGLRAFETEIDHIVLPLLTWPRNTATRSCGRVSGSFLAGLVIALLLPASACLAEQPPYRHGISLLHDLKYPADFAHFEYSNPSAPKGGHLSLATTWPVRNFSGAWGTGVANAAGLERTMDRLFVRSADEPSAMYGLLADGVALSADRKSLYIRLHPKARWRDGVPVTADDIRFSYEVMEKTSLAGKVYLGSWIESFELVNARELVIRHKDVFTHSNLIALTTFPVRPAHYYADRDPGETTLEPPLVSGPYRIAGFDRKHVVYERVDDYWGRDLPVNRGRQNFDTIRYDVYRDATVRREAFRKGLFDVLWETDIRYWVDFYDTPALRAGRILKDTRSVSRYIGRAKALVFNSDRERLRDARVREALTLAYDFEWQNRVFNYDSQSRALSYFAGSPFAASGLPTAEEHALLAPYRGQLSDRVFTESFGLPRSSGWGSNRAALERARRLLIDAGWTFEDGRLVDARGRRFRIEIATQEAWAKRILLPYIETLSTLGIDARFRLIENVVAVKYKRQRRFDIFLIGHEMMYPPMGQLHNNFSSENALPDLGGNLAGIRDPVVDALVEQAQRAPDLETAGNVCRALDRVLVWGFYHIPLHQPEEERLLYWDKFGRPDESTAIYEYLTGGLARVIDSWWIDDAKVESLKAEGRG